MAAMVFALIALGIIRKRFRGINVIPLNGVYTFSQKVMVSLVSIRRNFHRIAKRLSCFPKEKFTRRRSKSISLWKMNVIIYTQKEHTKLRPSG